MMAAALVGCSRGHQFGQLNEHFVVSSDLLSGEIISVFPEKLDVD
jgi:hypothetical protein